MSESAVPARLEIKNLRPGRVEANILANVLSAKPKAVSVKA